MSGEYNSPSIFRTFGGGSGSLEIPDLRGETPWYKVTYRNHHSRAKYNCAPDSMYYYYYYYYYS